MNPSALTPAELHALRRTIIAALASDDPVEDESLFVLPPEDMPPSNLMTSPDENP
jgi:hypothetical protein